MQCQKPQKLGVGMAVCRKDRAYKHYTNNPIPTSFLYVTSFLDYSSMSVYLLSAEGNVLYIYIALSFELYTSMKNIFQKCRGM